MEKNKKIDEMSPEEYLAYLQQRCYEFSSTELNKITTNKVSSEFLDKFVKASFNEKLSEEEEKNIIKILKEHCEKLESSVTPTNYQEKYLYSVLKKFSDKILAIINEENLKISEKIIVGTLPTGEVNAMAITVPKGGLIITLNYGLFIFIHLFAKVVSSFFPIKENQEKMLTFSFKKEDITLTIKGNKEGHNRFLEVLSAYLIFENTHYAPPYLQKGQHLVLTTVFREIAEFFVIAHEYSHIILGHCNKDNNLKRKLLNEVEVDIIAKNWEQELEADSLALQITLKYGQEKGYDLTFSYVGIDFLFSCFEVIEETSGSEQSSTHPQAKDRREFLREQLLELFKDQARGATHLGKIVQYIISELWKINKTRFEKIQKIQAS